MIVVCFYEFLFRLERYILRFRLFLLEDYAVPITFVINLKIAVIHICKNTFNSTIAIYV